MDFTRLRCMGSLFSMLHQACRNVALYNNNHPDFPMPIDQLEKYMQVMYFLVSEDNFKMALKHIYSTHTRVIHRHY